MALMPTNGRELLVERSLAWEEPPQVRRPSHFAVLASGILSTSPAELGKAAKLERLWRCHSSRHEFSWGVSNARRRASGLERCHSCSSLHGIWVIVLVSFSGC